MNCFVLTLFPELIEAIAASSILGRAVNKGCLNVTAVNIRDYSADVKHHKVDDYTYGGGAGMLMQAQPVYDAYMAVCEQMKQKHEGTLPPHKVVYLTPQGETFSQRKAEALSLEEELVFLCGHYEGIDERVIEEIVTDEISVGDYVLTGGELPAMVVLDAVARFVPGVLSNDESATTDSFAEGLLEYPQYSRPEVWKNKRVPEVLLSGDHKKVDEWRYEQALERTRLKRPDLYARFLDKGHKGS